MPRQSGLLCRNGRFYLNMRVPTPLRALYGRKEIVRKSLGTSDYREAVSRVRFEAFKQDAEFAAKLRKLEETNRASVIAPKILEISDREAHEIVTKFFVGLEKNAEEWWNDEGERLTEDEREEAVGNLNYEAAAYAGNNKHVAPEQVDGQRELECFIEAEGLSIQHGSPAYRKLRPLFRLAMIENACRSIDRATVGTVTPREPLFRDAFAHTNAPALRQRVTLGGLLTRYSEWLTEAGRTEGTHRTYQIPARLLREVLGEGTALEAITRADVERLFKLLRRAPANATKRYRGMTLEEAIATADKRGDAQRLRAKTLGNYFNNITAIFNFAVEKGLIAENPAKDRYLRATFAAESERTEKVLFTKGELNRLFRAPLYSGCRDDGTGFAEPGPKKPRRGRFWVPLLSLFHGLRCNEATQLYSEDVSEEDGIPFFEIRAERADKSKCDKRLKTMQSKRRVPIHPEVIRMGFLEYVAERRRDSLHPRLFPDLACGATGYFSGPFSKWFGRFLKSAIGTECEATFHSFRHHFRSALAEAGVSIPDVEELGGWRLMKRSAESKYDSGRSIAYLREQIAKVKYEGLNLSHLHKKGVKPVATDTSNCRVRRLRA